MGHGQRAADCRPARGQRCPQRRLQPERHTSPSETTTARSACGIRPTKSGPQACSRQWVRHRRLQPEWPDSRRWDYDGDLGLWKTTGGRRPAAFALGSTVVSVAFSPNGQTLAGADDEGHVGLWDTVSERRIATLSEGNQVNSVAFSPNGHTLAVGTTEVTSAYGTWPAKSGSPLCLRAPWVNSVALQPERPDSRCRGAGW